MNSGNLFPSASTSQIVIQRDHPQRAMAEGQRSPMMEDGFDELHDLGDGIRGDRRRGGRPKDAVWAYDGTSSASCSFCNWSIDKPKAFRMRQHILTCQNATADARMQMQHLEDIRIAAERKPKTPTMKTASSPQLPEASTSAAMPSPNMQSSSSMQQSQSSALIFGGSPVLGSMGTLNMSPSDPRKRKYDQQGMSGPMMKAPHLSRGGSTRSAITCHVLDATSGKPAAGMNVRLDKLLPSGYSMLQSTSTDPDGRCNELIQIGFKVEPGVYKITFFTSEFFAQRGIKTFYPYVEVTFEIQDGQDFYHIPLLMSPFAYSTYRGS